MQSLTQQCSSVVDLENSSRGVKAELKKVVWPTKKELINYTIVVFLVTIFIALIISVLDGPLCQLFNTSVALCWDKGAITWKQIRSGM